LGPLNKGAPVHPTANTTLDRLNQLAALTGVILPDLGRNTSNAPAKSDLALVADYIRGYVPVNLEGRATADAAAARLGASQVTELVRTTKRDRRDTAYTTALLNGWIPGDLTTISAVSRSEKEAADHLRTLIANEQVAPTLSAEDVTAWILSRDFDSATTKAFWNMPNFPSGNVSYTTALHFKASTVGFDAHRQGVNRDRLAMSDVIAMATADPNLLGFAVTYATSPTADQLAVLYQDALNTNPADRRIHIGAVVARLLDQDEPTQVAIACLRDYLAGPYASQNYQMYRAAVLVLANKHLSRAALVSLIANLHHGFDAQLIINYIAGRFAKNQPTRAIADQMVSVANPAHLWEPLTKYAQDDPLDSGAAAPSVFDALIPALRHVDVAPIVLISELAHPAESTPEYGLRTQLCFKAAAQSFATASPVVQARLWRAMTNTQSIVGYSGKSFDQLTELFIARDAEAAARVAAKATA
jgi:hypothetical protein